MKQHAKEVERTLKEKRHRRRLQRRGNRAPLEDDEISSEEEAFMRGYIEFDEG